MLLLSIALFYIHVGAHSNRGGEIISLLFVTEQHCWNNGIIECLAQGISGYDWKLILEANQDVV